MIKVAVLDDYQRVARTLADWTLVDARATVEVFHDHLADADAVVARLLDFDVVCVMRERTPLPRAILERLPKRSTSRRRRSAGSRCSTPATARSPRSR